MDEDWHINANPASGDFLVPTSLEARIDNQVVASQADYPEASTLRVPFGDKPIDVYKRQERIPLRLTGEAVSANREDASVHVRIQACNDKGRCLAPATP
jgi:hypothetical protein